MTQGPAFDARFLDELQARVAALIADTPAADLQRNLKTLLAQQFARLELATREEFDTQSKVLARTRAKLEALERRVAELERAHTAAGDPTSR
jgi:ubiquinone biosynthesis accessory factor UbiK